MTALLELNSPFRPLEPILMGDSIFTKNEPVKWIHNIPCPAMPIATNFWKEFGLARSLSNGELLELAKRFPPDDSWFEGDEPEIF